MNKTFAILVAISFLFASGDIHASMSSNTKSACIQSQNLDMSTTGFINYWTVKTKEIVKTSYCNEYILLLTKNVNVSKLVFIDAATGLINDIMSEYLNNNIDIDLLENIDVDENRAYLYTDDELIIIGTRDYSFNKYKLDNPLEELLLVDQYIVLSFSFRIICYDYNMKLVWLRNNNSFFEIIKSDGVNLYAGRWSSPNAFYCYDLKSGKVNWKSPSNDYFYCLGTTKETAVIVGRNGFYCHLKDGALKWHFASFGLTVYLDFVVTGDSIITCGEKEVVRVDVKNGNVLWKKSISDRINEIHILNNKIFVCCKKSLVVLDYSSGDISSSINTRTSIVFSCGNRVYLNDKEYLYCCKEIPRSVTLKEGKKQIFDQENDVFLFRIAPKTINNSLYTEVTSFTRIYGKVAKYFIENDRYMCFITNKTDEMQFQIGESAAIVNGKQVQIDPNNPNNAPVLVNGIAMIPLRFLAWFLGCKVEWKPDTKEIVVTYQP